MYCTLYCIIGIALHYTKQFNSKSSGASHVLRQLKANSSTAIIDSNSRGGLSTANQSSVNNNLPASSSNANTPSSISSDGSGIVSQSSVNNNSPASSSSTNTPSPNSNGDSNGVSKSEVFQNDSYKYAFINNSKVEIEGYIGPGGSITIPSSIDGKPVTSIGNGAFFNCFVLTNVTIPNSITSIGFQAFADCGLTNVAIPSGVTSIGVDAFCECCSLTNVTISNSVISIGYGAFEGSNLRNVIIPNSVTSIGDEAFYHCESLATATLPDKFCGTTSSIFNATLYNGTPIQFTFT